jgi:formylmethanofuran dehydrogenase subunit E
MMDNYDFFERHQAEQDRGEKEFPTCCECGSTIYEEFCYEYNDEPICFDCLYENHRRLTESFM